MSRCRISAAICECVDRIAHAQRMDASNGRCCQEPPVIVIRSSRSSGPRRLAPFAIAACLGAQVALAQPSVETRRADPVIEGVVEQDRPEGLGVALAHCADADGDGRRDLAIGAPYSDATGVNSGCVYIHSSATGERLHAIAGPSAGALFGSALADAGDVDNDGLTDLLVGAPGYLDREATPGRAYVLSGADQSLILEFKGELDGLLLGRSFGAVLDGVGDVDADGYDDLVIADPEYREANRPLVRGAAYVFSGRTGDLRFKIVSPEALDYFASAVAGVGDIDGDGRPDFALGAPGSDGDANQPATDCGRLRIYSGRNGVVLRDEVGGQAHDRLGASVDDAGDLNGDGFADFIVGAPSRRGIDSGSALIIHGRRLNAVRRLEGVGEGEGFGSVVANIGDVDGDAHDDFAISAPRRGRIAAIVTPMLYPGAIEIYSGATSARLATIRGVDAESELFGVALLGAINMDDDPLSEVVIGDANNRVLVMRSPLACAADLSGDGVITALDIAILLTMWGTTNPQLNLAGPDMIDAVDMATLISAWGPCS